MDDEPAPPQGPAAIPPYFAASLASGSNASPIPPPEQAESSEDAYERAVAEYTVYKLTRTFAHATKALAKYDCRSCLDLLDELPPEHQKSAMVMAMAGKAHYELGEYIPVSTLIQVV